MNNNKTHLQQNKELARRFMEEVWGNCNMDVAEELLAENFVLHNPPQGVDPDKEGYKRWVMSSADSFANVESRTEQLIAEEDLVATRWTYVSTHAGEYMGKPPTNNTITFTGMSIDRFKDGKIVEEWLEMDALGMMMQLGFEFK
jgi:steroid delta-isomerase-like uncharacterized protein